MTPPDGIGELEGAGFEGFLTIGQLHSSSCLDVPNERGVYVVLTRSDAPHAFRVRSSAPVWRGKDPALAVEELAEQWVPGATVLYVGRARGPGVRARLRQRIKRYLRFGHGRVVGAWAGRLIWQLAEVSRLVVAWRVSGGDEDPADVEARLLLEFEARHGALPFANLRGETDGDEDEVKTTGSAAGEPSCD